MRPSLRARVTLGLAAITLCLAVVAGVAVTSLTRLGGAVDTILRENYRSVIACEEMKEALERQDSAALFALTGHADIGRPMLAAHRARFERAYAVEAHNVTLAAEGPAVRALDARYRAYVAAVDGALAGGAGTDGYFRELLPRFTALKETVQHILAMNHATMEAADRNARAMARRSTAVTLAVGAAALLVALWLAWRLPATILAPVRSLAAAARAVGDGDLDLTVADPGVAELEPLAESFRKMVAQLRAYRQSSLGELLAAKDLANATVRCLLDPVVVFSREGEVLLANEAAEAAFGLRAGDGEPVPEGIARVRDEALASGRAVTPRSFSEAMRWRDRAGERFFLVRAAPLAAEGQRAARAIVVAQDVTRLRRIDALKSDMVATVSHEFKTPLTSLRMATHLLLEPGTGPLTEGQREVVTAARDDTERLRALVDELLDLVRIESEAGELRRVPVAPRHLLQAAAEAHRTIARDKGVSLTVSAPDGLAPAAVDPEKMAIVLANLLSNAIRHTPAGGAVSLDAGDVAGALRVTIRDSGEGVDPEALARMFDRSAPGPRPVAPGGGRHGLGLTIAQEIVLQHGGEIRAASEPGRGSAFTVVIPRG